MKSGLTRRQQVAGLRDTLAGGDCPECAERYNRVPSGPWCLYGETIPPYRNDERGRAIRAYVVKYRCGSCGYRLLFPVPPDALPVGFAVYSHEKEREEPLPPGVQDKALLTGRPDPATPDD